MSEPAFQPNESLIWENRLTPDAQLVRRPVAFRGIQNGLAVVSFGLKSDASGAENLLSVLPSELSRPTPVQHPPAVPTREPETPIPLVQRRHALRLRHQSYVEA